MARHGIDPDDRRRINFSTCWPPRPNRAPNGRKSGSAEVHAAPQTPKRWRGELSVRRRQQRAAGRPAIGRSRQSTAFFGSLVAALATMVALLPDRAAEADVAPSTVQLKPVADTYVADSAPTTSYGSSDRLTASGVPGDRKVIYLRFQLPMASSEVSSAQLVLSRDLHHLSSPVTVHPVADVQWNEQLTATTAPPIGPGIQTVPTSASTTAVTFDVTNSLSGSLVSFAVTSSSTTDVSRFDSKEAGNYPPLLVLTPKQQPSSGGTVEAAPPSPTQQCTAGAKLVPTCGAWWGIAPHRFTSDSLDVGLADDERLAGQRFDLVHEYHVNDQLFPTDTERKLALDPAGSRELLINWKPATDMSWRAVADGRADARIDRLAAYIKATFPHEFFLTLWHEPEDDVVASAGSGYTAADYAAMYRHVVQRLRADGATKPVMVMIYMGYDNWAFAPWFNQLWPGDDVVDWIGIDPYITGDASGYMSGDLATLVNRPQGSFPGYYTWATTVHPGKPIMCSEWGVYESSSNPGGKAKVIQSVLAERSRFPMLKGFVYFDMNLKNQYGGNTSLGSSPVSLDAFRQLSSVMAASAPKPNY